MAYLALTLAKGVSWALMFHIFFFSQLMKEGEVGEGWSGAQSPQPVDQ